MTLSPSFFLQPTEKVAKNLLGMTLSHRIGGQTLSGIIVETEAYLGAKDPACHTYQGHRTPRVESMYLQGGYSYVYFIYGMYHCFNVVTGSVKNGEAVLIRALEPVKGIATMYERRPAAKKDQHLASGPGKLCQALQIDKDQNALCLRTSSLKILDSREKTGAIVAKPRIGIGDKGEATHWPLRFYLEGNSFISKK